MNKAESHDLNAELERLGQRLPSAAARIVGWVRKPASRWVRIPLGVALIAGGLVGFLPILGFWMIPLGMVLIAKDMPFLRTPVCRLVAWVNDKLAARERTNATKS